MSNIHQFFGGCDVIPEPAFFTPSMKVEKVLEDTVAGNDKEFPADLLDTKSYYIIYLTNAGESVYSSVSSDVKGGASGRISLFVLQPKENFKYSLKPYGENSEIKDIFSLGDLNINNTIKVLGGWGRTGYQKTSVDAVSKYYTAYSREPTYLALVEQYGGLAKRLLPAQRPAGGRGSSQRIIRYTDSNVSHNLFFTPPEPSAIHAWQVRF